MRILCCGNRERGDDGAGVLVARRLRDFGIEAETRTGEALELIEAWSGAKDVIVVDAVVTGAPAGAVLRLEGRQVTGACSLPGSTHGFDVAEAIELARTLGRLPERLRVYGIEGQRFELGTDVSPEVRQAVEEVARQIAAECRRPMESNLGSAMSPDV
ncbi:MAG TPA: hydrogenase maturation protease [Methylomirabilota bacterium]|nr:hydrogenase maturation protease [Methylomirabilota bacterium]